MRAHHRLLSGVPGLRGDSVDGRKYWFKRDGSEQRLMLSRPMQQTFANKQVTCIEYDGLTNDQEREIFQVRESVGFNKTAYLRPLSGYNSVLH